MKRFLKIVVGVILVLVILAVVAGSRGSNTARQSSTSSQAVVATSAPNVSKSNQASAPTATIEIGTAPENPAPFTQAITAGGVKVQLSNGRFETKLDYSKPKGGYK